MFSVLLKGGPVVPFLILCSCFGLYIVVQKILFFRITKLSNQDIKLAKNHLMSHGPQQTLMVLEQQSSVASKF